MEVSVKRTFTLSSFDCKMQELFTIYPQVYPQVKKILLDIATDHPKVMKDPEPIVLLRGFGESAIKLELRAFVNEKFSLFIQSDLNFEVLKKFSENKRKLSLYPKNELPQYIQNNENKFYRRT